MTVEQPVDLSHVFFINATEQPIDVYVNYAEEPEVTDLKPLTLGPEFKVEGKGATPYGTYTFSARPKDRPDAEVLGSASIDFTPRRSFAAVLHRMPDGTHRISIYENDFTPSDAPRMTVRHAAQSEPLTWHITPKDFKPEIPVDEREGSLRSGQWQMATSVVQNDYVFEVRLDGQLVAAHPDLELEHEKDVTVYIVGDPSPETDSGMLQRSLIVQEFQLPRGTPPPPEVTPPREPYSIGDHNLPIAFEWRDIEVWQTNPANAIATAVDPDGIVTDLAIAEIRPEVGGIIIPDHGVTPASSIGGQAAAIVQVLGDVPAGEYEVTLMANTRSLGQRATCTLLITVLHIDIDRLRAVTEQYERSGALDPDVGAVLTGFLDRAQQSLDAGDVVRACADLKDAVAWVSAAKDKGIEVDAANHLEREIKALRADLGCG